MADATPTPRMLRGDEADVFREHHAHLLNTVRSNVVATDAIQQDACSFAWLQFLRCQPDRDTAFSWLCRVAIREGWRLATQQRRDLHLVEDTRGEAPVTAEIALEARDALNALAGLPDRQRRYLTLLIGGHSYAEIRRHTHATYTNVNKHLVRARRTLRQQRPDTTT